MGSNRLPPSQFSRARRRVALVSPRKGHRGTASWTPGDRFSETLLKWRFELRKSSITGGIEAMIIDLVEHSGTN